MQTNKLDDVAKEVLLAIFKDGATSGERHVTTIKTLVKLLGWTVGEKSNELLMENLRKLLTNGYSIQNGEVFTMGSYLSKFELYKNEGLTVTVKVPVELVRLL